MDKMRQRGQFCTSFSHYWWGLGTLQGQGPFLVVPLQDHGSCDCEGRMRRGLLILQGGQSFWKVCFLGKVLLSSPSSWLGQRCFYTKFGIAPTPSLPGLLEESCLWNWGSFQIILTYHWECCENWWPLSLNPLWTTVSRKCLSFLQPTVKKI